MADARGKDERLDELAEILGEYAAGAATPEVVGRGAREPGREGETLADDASIARVNDRIGRVVEKAAYAVAAGGAMVGGGTLVGALATAVSGGTGADAAQFMLSGGYLGVLGALGAYPVSDALQRMSTRMRLTAESLGVDLAERFNVDFGGAEPVHGGELSGADRKALVEHVMEDRPGSPFGYDLLDEPVGKMRVTLMADGAAMVRGKEGGQAVWSRKGDSGFQPTAKDVDRMVAECGGERDAPAAPGVS